MAGGSGTGLPLPRQAVVTEALRRWWLDRYSLDEIRELAAELPG